MGKKFKSLRKLLAFLLTFAMMVSMVPADVATAASAKAVKKVVVKSGSKVVTKKTISLNVGKSTTLTTVVTPSSAKKKVAYKTSNKKVATVNSKGKVTAKKAGTAVITATTVDGGKTATCTVTVTDSTLQNAASAEILITNSIDGFENTVLTGTNADVKVLVKNAKDAPIGNNSVELTIQPLYGNGAKVFRITGDNNNYLSAKLTTDSDGYADFTVGLRGGENYTSTSPIYQSYKLVAKVTGSNVSAESTLSFGYIQTSNIEVLNNRYFEINDLEPSDNAIDWTGIGNTMSTNGSRVEEYVSSQKVSTEKDNHEVHFSATPYLITPTKSSETKIDTYTKEVNASSYEYGVYNGESNEKTTTWIEKVPAGLQYASLYFDKIVLSEYTVLQIKTYDAVSGALIKTYSLDSDNMKKDFAYQIPIQEDTAVNIEVSLLSAGQVNDDSNDGYVISHVEGLYKGNEVTGSLKDYGRGYVKAYSSVASVMGGDSPTLGGPSGVVHLDVACSFEINPTDTDTTINIWFCGATASITVKK